MRLSSRILRPFASLLGLVLLIPWSSISPTAKEALRGGCAPPAIELGGPLSDAEALPEQGLPRSFDGGTFPTPRAEPEVNASGPHERTAFYDFSNTWIFSRWSIVMETNRAVLMRNIWFLNERWSLGTPMPAGQERACPVAVYDDADRLVIVHGGYCWRAGMQEPIYTQPLLTLDLATGIWTERGPSMLPAGAAGVWNPRDRCLIVCGGLEYLAGQPIVHREAWAWFPSNGTWLRLADMPAPRHGQCAVWDPDDGLMLVFGGMNETSYFADVWAYDIVRNLWSVRSPVSDEAPLPRAYASAVWIPTKREMMVHGGENAEFPFYSTWGYSYANNSWTHRTSAPYARSMHGACWDSDRGLMVVCGRGQVGNSDTWTYDPAADSWGENLRLPGALRSGCACVYDPVEKVVLVIGGMDSGGECLGETRILRPGEMQWCYFSPGYMQPPVLDLGSDFHSLDRVSWGEELPPGTSIVTKMRVQREDGSWGAFFSVENGCRPQEQGRLFEWNMTFTASEDLLSTPVLKWVRFDYTVNRKPSCLAQGNATVFRRQPAQLSGEAGDPDGDPLEYRWRALSSLAGTFDDEKKRDAVYTPLSSGRHVLQLIVNDSLSEALSDPVVIDVINRAPQVRAGPDVSCYKMESVTLEADASDPDGDPLSFNWSQLSGPKVSLDSPHEPRTTAVPVEAGNCTFMLTASDGEDRVAVFLNLTVVSRPPTARLSAAPQVANLRTRVNFSALESEDPDGRVVQYLFDFGDGNRTLWTESPFSEHVYRAPGLYNATLRVRDDDGCESAPSEPVPITVENALPELSASVSPETGNVTTLFRFSMLPESRDPDGEIVLCEWDFGDGQGATGAQALHSYRRPGNYTAVLRVTDDMGGSSELSLSVAVVNLPPVIESATGTPQRALRGGERLSLSVVARDPEGAELHYSWSVDGAAVGEDASSFSFRSFKAGGHIVAVCVSDGELETVHEWRLLVRAGVEEGLGTGFALAAGAAIAVAAGGAAAAGMLLRRRSGARKR